MYWSSLNHMSHVQTVPKHFVLLVFEYLHEHMLNPSRNEPAADKVKLGESEAVKAFACLCYPSRIIVVS